MSDSPEELGTNSIAGNPTNPSINNTKMGIDVKNTVANSNMQTPEAQPQPDTPLGASAKAELAPGPAETYQAGDVVSPAPTDAHQPNTYGGNFGNDVQNSYNDPMRQANQESSINRGEVGVQGHLGATHGGFGNQYRSGITEHEGPAEPRYYGDGNVRPGTGDQNAYRAYDGRDDQPAEQGHAVRDTPTPPAMNFAAPSPTDGRGDSYDNRNLPSKGGADAAFQNDNGAPTVGAAYAADYGHTSGAKLPPGTPSNHLEMGPNGHGQLEDEHSSRGGYDNQGSQGGRAHDQQPAATGQGAPAPVNAPDAPQGEGYGYGHERSEQARATSPDTGDSRNGFGPGGSKEGDASQGHGSRGGSYDDQNPGARGPGYDDYTSQDKAKNYGQEQREDFRPADGDQPKEGDYGPSPRRNNGRDQ